MFDTQINETLKVLHSVDNSLFAIAICGIFITGITLLRLFFEVTRQ